MRPRVTDLNGNPIDMTPPLRPPPRQKNGRIGDTPGEFSVCQFFAPHEATYEYVRRYVGAEEALTAFRHYCTSVGAKLGTTRRVIVTDGGDCINAEWKRAEGITYLGEPNNPHLGKYKEGKEEEQPQTDPTEEST
jgi:hypothetical protein